MVETKELVTLFKIEKLNNDIEALIPFEVVEGTYDEENCTFTTQDGTVYLHIEEAISSNFGYARRIVVDIDPEAKADSVDSMNYMKTRKFNADNAYKYIRFTNEINKVYLKDKYSYSPQVMVDEDSKKYKENLEQMKIDTQAGESLSPSYIGIDKTPQEIYEAVKKTIKGQDEAIRMIATCLWATVNGRSNNITKKQMILIGPTGVGKTAIFKKLQQILNIPVIIFSVPGLSQAGYTGRSTDEILKQVYFECMEDRDTAEKAIVILDEYDKLAYNGNDKSGDVSTVGVQNELLKMVEGYTRVVELGMGGEDSFEIDTSNMIFIATGAFQELFEEDKSKGIGFCTQDKKQQSKIINGDALVKYGLKKESIGRFPIIIELNKLTREIFREIILESDESELLAHVHFLESLGVKISNLDEVIDTIIEDAIGKDIGARGLIATISNLFLEIIYQVANNPGTYSEVIIGKNIIKDHNDFTLTEKRIIKRTMKLNNKPNKLYR